MGIHDLDPTSLKSLDIFINNLPVLSGVGQHWNGSIHVSDNRI